MPVSVADIKSAVQRCDCEWTPAPACAYIFAVSVNKEVLRWQRHGGVFSGCGSGGNGFGVPCGYPFDGSGQERRRRRERARGGWKVFPEGLYKKAKEPGDKRLPVSRDQIQNFVDCILSRGQPVDDLHSAVRSDIVCHLVDISARTGKEIAWNPEEETIVGNDEAVQMMSRPLRKPWTL